MAPRVRCVPLVLSSFKRLKTVTTIHTPYRTVEKVIEVSAMVRSIVISYDVNKETERRSNLLANGYGEKFCSMPE